MGKTITQEWAVTAGSSRFEITAYSDSKPVLKIDGLGAVTGIENIRAIGEFLIDTADAIEADPDFTKKKEEEVSDDVPPNPSL